MAISKHKGIALAEQFRIRFNMRIDAQKVGWAYAEALSDIGMSDDQVGEGFRQFAGAWQKASKPSLQDFVNWLRNNYMPYDLRPSSVPEIPKPTPEQLARRGAILKRIKARLQGAAKMDPAYAKQQKEELAGLVTARKGEQDEDQQDDSSSGGSGVGSARAASLSGAATVRRRVADDGRSPAHSQQGAEHDLAEGKGSAGGLGGAAGAADEGFDVADDEIPF